MKTSTLTTAARARRDRAATALLAALLALPAAHAQQVPFDENPPPAGGVDLQMVPAPRNSAKAQPVRVARAQTVQARAVNQARDREPALSCRNIEWKPGDIIRLQAQPYKQIHVALPENGIDVIMGDKELWALDWINNRIFIKPTSRSTEARSTTISAIGQSGNAYEFLVTRVPDNLEISHCVYINGEGGGLISRSAWAKAAQYSPEGTAAMSRELASLRERNANLDRQLRENLKAYRKKLYSQYTWETGAFSRWNGGEVESVYDDGRFTFVRMKAGAQGLLTIMAEIEGRAMLLEYGYDAPTRTYQISGIFPKFTLRAGEQAMTITRAQEGSGS